MASAKEIPEEVKLVQRLLALDNRSCLLETLRELQLPWVRQTA